MSAAEMVEDEVLDEPTRSRKKLVVLLLLLVVAGAGGWWFFLGPANAEEAVEDVDGAIVPVEPMTTTVGHSALRHARVSIGVVLVNDTAPDVIAPKLPLLQDALLREMAALSADELRTVEGSDGLRTRLSAEARAIWGDDLVRRVILTELLVQ